MAQRRSRNKEAIKARHQRKFASDPDYAARCRAQWKKYRDANKEKRAAAYRKWKAANPERKRAADKRCAQRNAQKRAADTRKRRALKPELWQASWLKQVTAKPETLMTMLRGFSSLSEQNTRELVETIPSDSLSPLELLMMKEESE